MKFRELKIAQQFRVPVGKAMMLFIKYDETTAYCLTNGAKLRFEGEILIEPKRNFFDARVDFATMKLGQRFKYGSANYIKVVDGGLRISDAALFKFEDGHEVRVSLI